jgi:hypothetical protein
LTLGQLVDERGFEGWTEESGKEEDDPGAADQVILEALQFQFWTVPSCGPELL